MKNRTVLILQKKYQKSGFALVAPQSGKIYAFARDIKKLYDTIEKKKIDDRRKVVMYIPDPNRPHVF